MVLECSGKILTPEALQPYFEQGVRKVIVAAPVKTRRAQYRDGRQRSSLRPAATSHHHGRLLHHQLSCSGREGHSRNISESVMAAITTIHDVTNTQTLVDLAHKDLRRARSALMSLIPTTTGSATAIGLIYPELKGKLNGMAVRVPLLNASLTDCVFEVATAHQCRRSQRTPASRRRGRAARNTWVRVASAGLGRFP